MRQVKARGKRATPKRATKRTAPKRAAKRATKSSARRKTTPKTRGKKLSAARVWERRIEGWRRLLIRHAYLKNYAALAALTIGAYALWATGIVTRTGDFVALKANAAIVDAGFTVQRVTFSGHIETSPSDVLDALALEIGTPIFAVNLDDLKLRVESLDWVEEATIVRALPGTIHVAINEREPYAVWQYEGQLHIISADGTVIGDARAEDYGHLPHVVGAGAEAEAGLLFTAMETVPQIAPRVRYAVRVSDRRWDLHFDSGVVVQLPERNIADALMALAEYEEEYRLLARAIDSVDLRLGDRIVVRPHGDGPVDGTAFAAPMAEPET